MAKKAKAVKAKKDRYEAIPGSAVAEKVTWKKHQDPSVFTGETGVISQGVESDNEEMSEAEVEAMEQRSTAKKEAAIARVEAEVDSQEWTLADPVIPENLVGRVWIAVFRCPEGHKTKATNRQADHGVWCWKCRGSGQKVKASIMPQFLTRPVSDDPDVAKRKKAAKGAQ